MPKQCPCPDPPGGAIVCEDHQFGMCAYHDGKKVGGCLDLPTTVAIITDDYERHLAAANWILTTLTGVGRNFDTPLDDESLRVLSLGEFVTSRGQLIRFSLPDDLDLQLARRATARAARAGAMNGRS
jgi:hypothetical protein